MTDTRTKTEKGLAVAAFASAAAMAFLAFLTQGEINNSALWYIAQALTYSATMLGIKYQVQKYDHNSKANDKGLDCNPRV